MVSLVHTYTRVILHKKNLGTWTEGQNKKHLKIRFEYIINIFISFSCDPRKDYCSLIIHHVVVVVLPQARERIAAIQGAAVNSPSRCSSITTARNFEFSSTQNMESSVWVGDDPVFGFVYLAQQTSRSQGWIAPVPQSVSESGTTESWNCHFASHECSWTSMQTSTGTR